jgi:hypothetical protein
MGVHVLYTAGHHRKLVIVERKVLYEGSLNERRQNKHCGVESRKVSMGDILLCRPCSREIDVKAAAGIPRIACIFFSKDQPYFY